MKIIDTTGTIPLESLSKVADREDALSEESENQRVLEEGFAYNEYYEEIP